MSDNTMEKIRTEYNKRFIHTGMSYREMQGAKSVFDWFLPHLQKYGDSLKDGRMQELKDENGDLRFERDHLLQKQQEIKFAPSVNSQCTHVYKEKQQESDAWISVEDRLPDENQDVVFHCKRYTNLIAIGTYRTNVVVYGGSRYRISDEVTHWMPLPKSPTIQIKQ